MVVPSGWQVENVYNSRLSCEVVISVINWGCDKYQACMVAGANLSANLYLILPLVSALLMSSSIESYTSCLSDCLNVWSVNYVKWLLHHQSNSSLAFVGSSYTTKRLLSIISLIHLQVMTLVIDPASRIPSYWGGFKTKIFWVSFDHPGVLSRCSIKNGKWHETASRLAGTSIRRRGRFTNHRPRDQRILHIQHCCRSVCSMWRGYAWPTEITFHF